MIFWPERHAALEENQQLNCGKAWSETAQLIAIEGVTIHLNGHTEKTSPFQQVIATATGNSAKTVLRAVRKFEAEEYREAQRYNASRIIRNIVPQQLRWYPIRMCKKHGQIGPAKGANMPSRPRERKKKTFPCAERYTGNRPTAERPACYCLLALKNRKADRPIARLTRLETGA
jgi:hypothetical protein